ncbi:MAG: GntR family transcriptional regulator [Acidimicrobiales bacterium]
MNAGLYTAGEGKGLRRDHAYEELKTRLLVGEFALNRRLAEERLAALLGVSRTPVREALVRLFAEGLVERDPDGGWCPAAPDVSVVHDLYEVRMALELQGLRRPLGNNAGCAHDPGVLEPLRDEWRALEAEPPDPDPGFVSLDEDFHVRLAGSSGNPSLAELLGLVNERIRIVRMQDFLTEARVRTTIAQHLGILEAVLGGDIPLAVARFGRHLGESMAVVEDRAIRALARMASRKEIRA